MKIALPLRSITIFALTAITVNAADVYVNSFENSLGEFVASDSLSATHGFVSTVPPVTDGSFAYQYTNTTSGPSGLYLKIFEVVNTSAPIFKAAVFEGNTITFDVTALNMNTGGYSNIALATWQQDGGSGVFTQIDNLGFSNDNTSQELSYTFTAADEEAFQNGISGFGLAKLEFYANYQSTTPGTFGIDNLRVSSIPETSTYAIGLGLAAITLALIARKRRS